MQFSERMQLFGESIFTTLAKMKEEKESRGETVIDLSIGTPNIPPASHIIDALVEAAKDEKNYVYAIKDLAELHRAVAKWYQNRYQVKLNPETEIVSLLGSQEGLAHISLSVVDPGDTVLVQDPCYPIFGDGPRIAGAKLAYMPLRKECDYLIDFENIEEETAREAKLMVVSYPNNPTAAVAPDYFYEKLIAFARKYDIIVLHDNAYSELIFDDNVQGKSFLSYPGAKEVGVEFNSLSKTYGLAGARIGFCIGNEQIVKQLTRLKSNMDYGMFLPVQKAAIAAILGDQQCVKTTREAYKRRRDLLCDGFSSIGWKMQRSPATMFVWAQIPGNFASSLDFVRTLLEEAGVMVTPGSAFGPSGEGFVRIALVQEEEMIKQAVQRVRESKIL
ncbi:aminotransferase class I/II-fold pyridoxal phosphate-dependent enzyme [Ruminococcus sp. OA3]|uniref:aminotransferase class I/II-fold pyridoxal phosphate-dependent enzyme n=1 Tax=Ruminococcus sp. OA3 TaxID=2914164 RepID=UPI001F06D222|nr:aminotransferase class I/II-fold pyridoxal phosphate-dependent enzyme [Ruminococcus sp. OA3]MCH1983830.1 aminotransferase class I/II-fold pyridoxal phosphate-dependent enzyme [Ruminococcus sp. OA3]